jgi:hypothetical protein
MLEELPAAQLTRQALGTATIGLTHPTPIAHTSGAWLGSEHIRDYQSWSPSTTVCALPFFYHNGLHRKWMIEHIP